MSELWNNLVAMWKGLDDKRRIGFLVAAGAAVVLIAVAAVWLLRTDYGVLFADLDERDAAAIVEDLKHRKVAFRIEDNGTKILVPEQHVHETRLALMSKGTLLNGAVGFEIFDNKELGMTEYTQKINYQRALQGELARTIMAINQVKFARVHLVVPEASLFKRDKTKAKGSVSVVLKPGGRLTAEQIAGIQRLVAASAPGMEPGMVTVFDQRGVALSVLEDSDSPEAGGSTRLRLKREVEDYLTRKIATVMDRTFGPGQGIVSVDVTINFDDIKRTQQEVIPVHTDAGDEGGIVVRKRQALQRQSGAPITKASDTDGVVTGGTGVNSSTEVEFEFGRRVEEVVTAPGGIRRLSVGVLVPKPMTEEQLARLRNLIAMTAGVNEGRGDAIAVHSIDQLMQSDAGAGDAARGNTVPDSDPGDAVTWRNWMAVAAVAVVALLALVAGLWLAGRWRSQRARTRQQQLAQEQRESLLTEIKRWIDAEKSRPLEDANG